MTVISKLLLFFRNCTNTGVGNILRKIFQFIVCFCAFQPSGKVLRYSYIRMPAATETLRESMWPDMGMETMWSHLILTSERMPLPSLPMTMAVRFANLVLYEESPFMSAP